MMRQLGRLLYRSWRDSARKLAHNAPCAIAESRTSIQ